MTSTAILAARMQEAHARALGVIEDHGGEAGAERAERMRKIGTAAGIRNPQELASFQSELIAGLAEIVEDLAARTPAKKGKKA
ncbi:MAG: hypothetical protein M3R38_13555 [Actinomycetota bacterium]|nr:hypothetical protein [Actinomycetota bacterium]